MPRAGSRLSVLGAAGALLAPLVAATPGAPGDAAVEDCAVYSACPDQTYTFKETYTTACVTDAGWFSKRMGSFYADMADVSKARTRALNVDEWCILSGYEAAGPVYYTVKPGGKNWPNIKAAGSQLTDADAFCNAQFESQEAGFPNSLDGNPGFYDMTWQCVTLKKEPVDCCDPDKWTGACWSRRSAANNWKSCSTNDQSGCAFPCGRKVGDAVPEGDSALNEDSSGCASCCRRSENVRPLWNCPAPEGPGGPGGPGEGWPNGPGGPGEGPGEGWPHGPGGPGAPDQASQAPSASPVAAPTEPETSGQGKQAGAGDADKEAPKRGSENLVILIVALCCLGIAFLLCLQGCKCGSGGKPAPATATPAADFQGDNL